MVWYRSMVWYCMVKQLTQDSLHGLTSLQVSPALVMNHNLNITNKI